MDLEVDERALRSFEISVKGLENVASAEARGTGSFGSVYEVEAYGLPCIAKCIHPILIRYEQQLQRSHHDVGREKATVRKRFYKECLLLSKLRHPNIVQFMGVARVPNTGEMALIMEALFSDLGNLVEQHKEISDPIKISLMLDVANGLLYLHSQNPPVVHRDLSAANVLVSVDLRGKIADLGVAKFLDHGYLYPGQQTVQPGAYAYMAPEALKETPVYDTKLDIFSLGAVLLYTINNEFPKVHEVELSYDDVKEGRIQIAKRKRAINLAERHCLFPLTLQCLRDKPEKRPNTSNVRDSIRCACAQNKRRKLIEIDKIAQSDIEASLRDARSTIAELERQVVTLRRQKSEESQTTKESDLHKQLDEMKDRNTALEQQMMEYSNIVQDQTKLIQNLKGSGGSAELHKQQLEYSEAIESLCKKMEYTEKVAQENKETLQINIKLAGELEDYRSQTKRLIQDIQQKDQELMVLRQTLAQKPSSSNETASLELATMKQKLIAWQDEVEKLAPLRERVDQLEGELAEVHVTNRQLHQQIQQLEGDIEKSHTELSKKTSDYNTLNERFAELQQTKINLENELQPLLEERASILRENAHLMEGSDPKKYANLKKEHEALQAHCQQLEQALDEQSSLLSAHQESNAEMQQQLDKATDPERLQFIHTRMERYKQEHDAARSRIEEVEKQLVIYQSEKETLAKQLQEVSDQSEKHLIELQLKMTQQEKSLAKAADYETRMRRYRDERNKAMSDNRVLKKQLTALEGAISDLLAQTGHQDTSECLHTLTGGFESMNVNAEVEQPLEHDQGYQGFPPGFPHEDYQPQLFNTDEDYGDQTPQPLDQEAQYQHGAARGDGDDRQSSGSRGSLERPKIEVYTKEGVAYMNIITPPVPLSVRDRPTVIVKRGNKYEAGTLMYIGTFGGKEIAGVQMSIRQSTGYTDGTYKDGRRYFKCPPGFGLYVPMSEIFVESVSEI